MYKIGDTVVHPMHGAGTIEAIRTIEVLGKKQDYYTIRMAVGGMTTSVPVLNADKVGLREVINSAEAKKLLEAFRKIPLNDDANWNKRQRENMEKLKSGNLYQVLEVLKDLLMIFLLKVCRRLQSIFVKILWAVSWLIHSPMRLAFY